MKTVLLTAGLLLAPAAFAENCFLQGSFASQEGSAQWKSADHPDGGVYAVKTQLKNNNYRAQYKWDDASTNLDFSVSCKDNGFFDIKSFGGDEILGRGYCFNDRCHYSLVFGSESIEETLLLTGDTLHKVGSKTSAGDYISWSETLTRE